LTESQGSSAQVKEVVGRFADRESFTAAVKALKAEGFADSDLSVLDTHESISASDTTGNVWRQTLTGLVGEIKYIGPITSAGLIAIATGPMGAAIAAGIAAGLTGLALQEVLEDVKATPHTESFARALQSGAVLLWVRITDDDHESVARRTLESNGAEDVHLHHR